MKNYQPHITIMEKDNTHYNQWIISKLKKPAIIYIDKDDNIIFVSLYRSIKARKSNKNYKDMWWKPYNVTPIECRQDGDDVIYVLYNENGTPKETDGNFDIPESEYEIVYVDEWNDESDVENIDENELYDVIRSFVVDAAEKERPYRYRNMSIESVLDKTNKIIVRNTKSNKTYNITYRFIDNVSADIADKNHGFASVGDVAETIWEIVVEALKDE